MDGKLENEKITLKDAYEELWRCRDFELAHFWQRSVFLGTFLLSAFAAYGALALNWMEKGLSNRPVVNCFCFGLSVVGILLSFLWIMMAKGSKAWYERYEEAICHFVEIACINTEDGKRRLFEKGVEKVIAFAYGNDFKRYSDPISSYLWNTKGGSYSPSKINIALGHLSLFIWLSLSAIHIIVARGFVVSTLLTKENMPAIMILALSFGLLFFWLYSKQFLKSTILEKK